MRFFKLWKKSSTQRLLKLIGGPWPTISQENLGLSLQGDLFSNFGIAKKTKQYTIYHLQINSWHFDFNGFKEDTKNRYRLLPIPGFLFIPTTGHDLHGFPWLRSAFSYKKSESYGFGTSGIVL